MKKVVDGIRGKKEVKEEKIVVRLVDGEMVDRRWEMVGMMVTRWG